MIDTTDVPDLFRFLVTDLQADGAVVRSTDPEAQELMGGAEPSETEGRDQLELAFSLGEFAAAIRRLGAGAELMWPGTTTESAGLRLFLTHLDEQRATSDALGTGSLRIALDDGAPLLVPL